MNHTWSSRKKKKILRTMPLSVSAFFFQILWWSIQIQIDSSYIIILMTFLFILWIFENPIYFEIFYTSTKWNFKEILGENPKYLDVLCNHIHKIQLFINNNVSQKRHKACLTQVSRLISLDLCVRKKLSCDSHNAEKTDVKFTVENISKVNQFLEDGNDTNSNNT